MRANEVGVKSPESNTRELITEHHDEKFFRNLVSGQDEDLLISLPSIIQFQRDTITIIKNISTDWGAVGFDLPGINNNYLLGLSLLNAVELEAGITRGHMVNKSIWGSYMSIVVMSQVGAIVTSEHEDEEVFATILRDMTTNDIDGLYLWAFFSKSEGKVDVLGIVEYDVKFIQRTFSEEYTHLSVRYSHGWEDCEFEESFIEDDE